jgi:hypothetical protein
MARRLGRFEAADDDVRVYGVQSCLDGCQSGQHTILSMALRRWSWSSAAASNFSARAPSSVSQTSLAEQSHQGGLAVAVTVSNRDYFEKP